MSNKIIAIILAYNCQNEIIKTLKKIQKFEKYFFKICIIDNNSRDKTFNRANNFIKSRNISELHLDNASSCCLILLLISLILNIFIPDVIMRTISFRIKTTNFICRR